MVGTPRKIKTNINVKTQNYHILPKYFKKNKKNKVVKPCTLQTKLNQKRMKMRKEKKKKKKNENK